MECINCGHQHQNTYCPVCGEKSDTEQITFKSVLSSTVGTLTNMDRGFLYNLKQLWLDPQSLIHQYLAGKRKGIFNPLSYAIVATSLYLILDSLIGHGSISIPRSPMRNDAVYDQGIEAGRFLRGKFKFFWLLNLLFLSIFTKLFFKRYNFFEHLSINAFVVGQATLIGIALTPFNVPIVVNPLVFLMMTVLLYRIYKGTSGTIGLLVNIFFSLVFSFLMFFIIPFLVVFFR